MQYSTSNSSIILKQENSPNSEEWRHFSERIPKIQTGDESGNGDIFVELSKVSIESKDWSKLANYFVPVQLWPYKIEHGWCVGSVGGWTVRTKPGIRWISLRRQQVEQMEVYKESVFENDILQDQTLSCTRVPIRNRAYWSIVEQP